MLSISITITRLIRKFYCLNTEYAYNILVTYGLKILPN